jgi:hypothetical protein
MDSCTCVHILGTAAVAAPTASCSSCTQRDTMAALWLTSHSLHKQNQYTGRNSTHRGLLLCYASIPSMPCCYRHPVWWQVLFPGVPPVLEVSPCLKGADRVGIGGVGVWRGEAGAVAVLYHAHVRHVLQRKRYAYCMCACVCVLIQRCGMWKYEI